MNSNNIKEQSEQSSEREKDEKRVLKKSTNDFIFGKIIGEGSFSMVCLAKEIETKRIFAIKICEKNLIFKEKKQKAIMREKEIMYILNAKLSPYIIQLYATFQDSERLYFVMNYAKNGDLLSYISKVGCFNEECSVFYAGELLLAIEHLHRLGIIHRDLKPENILLNENMHIQVSDFGSATFIKKSSSSLSSSSSSSTSSSVNRNVSLANVDSSLEGNRKNSFVGTAQYVSPEMLSEKRTSPSSDLWAFACILYQMISGLPPFRAATEYLIFQKIIKLEYDFPDDFNVNAKNLIENLLMKEVQDRIGIYDDIETKGYHSIRSHPFFNQLNNKCSLTRSTQSTSNVYKNSILNNGSRFDTLYLETPPKILPYLRDLKDSDVQVIHLDDNLEPGFDQKQLTRILGLALNDEKQSNNVKDISNDEMKERIEKQKSCNEWHRFVDNNLILKQGLLDKRKGLFPRRRMFLLTTGPHLYYVDPINYVLKGQIPFSLELRTEPKNFKTFFVHTPNRTYYLEDPDGTAPEWCKAIDDVYHAYLLELKKSSSTSNKDSSSSKSFGAI